MKQKIILKGFHRPLSLVPPFMHNIVGPGKNTIDVRIYVFTESCRYILGNGDQMDWNKLYGYCYGIDGIHKFSGRIVWRYNPNTDKIELAAYCYENGVRLYQLLGEVDINQKVLLCVEVVDNEIKMSLVGKYTDDQLDQTVRKTFKIDFDKKLMDKFKFSCDLYFGGNRMAPQNIKILYENVDY